MAGCLCGSSEGDTICSRAITALRLFLRFAVAHPCRFCWRRFQRLLRAMRALRRACAHCARVFPAACLSCGSLTLSGPRNRMNDSTELKDSAAPDMAKLWKATGPPDISASGNDEPFSCGAAG